ncbi:MAG: LVIVD repeat-containing protein [Chitinophagales bacterium]
MKKINTFTLLLAMTLLGSLAVFLQSCNDKCDETYTYTSWQPVYLSYAELRGAVASETARELSNTGQIYFRAPYLFINELNEGVHIIDNSNPANPQNIGFIHIPGNLNIAVRDQTLFADSYVDLIAININDPLGATEIGRIEDVFERHYTHNPEEGLVINWEEVELTQENDCVGNQNVVAPWFRNNDIVFADQLNSLDPTFSLESTTNSSSPPPTTSSAPSVGIGGSLARFTITQNRLYAITWNEMLTFDILTPANMEKKGDNIDIGWGIETLYPFGNYLLIGSQTGMFVYSIDNPDVPTRVSEFTHVRSCDPVVAEGDYAFVTLRSGSACQGFTNQLDVLDISNIEAPDLVKSYDMTNPHGLGIDNGTLFICDGESGLKVYDANDVYNISSNQLAHYDDITALDVIPYNQVLMLIGEGGLHQYSYADLENIELMSTIPIVK